ncbi:hypothetical protein F6R98_02610 [Candidatus Methylospira mobilis]|uniref:Uncharacterized protein n=1 Tax=Candidatus Methylospira mobilis TaxID=1808979 RepID=A0A5Q0BEU3_9GAMM|nr:hypothetical protein [Candidatus Methylospira mobilis]QFY41652.1 hypothetical protein F6R98_02610 [Candidatus Methylospira mobilis]
MLGPRWQGLAFENKMLVFKASLITILIYALIIYFFASMMNQSRSRSNETHIARMSPTLGEPGHTPPEPYPSSENYVTVKVGTYFDNVDVLSIKDSMWSTNFYVWFNWKGDAKLDPGGKLVVVDGTINKKELLEEYHGDNGNYQKYRISAKIIKFFDTSRVPLENHMLNVYIENGEMDSTKLRFVADEASNISSRLKISGFKITGKSNVVKPHTYKTNYGSPNLPADSRSIYSQYIAAIEISRINYGFYFKVFLSLFAAILLALSSFCINPADVAPRFGLPTSAYFGAVANTYLVSSLLPASGSFGLVDSISLIGLFTIFIAIVLSLVAAYYHRNDNKDLVVVFDKVMLWVVGLCCLVANIIIPWCANSV